MIDGSLAKDGKTPNTYEANVAITKAVVDYAHPLGVTSKANWRAGRHRRRARANLPATPSTIT